MEKISLGIRDLNGATLHVCVSVNDTVATLKNEIKKKNGLEPDQQRLMFTTKWLRDENRTLRDYGIRENCMLNLLTRLQGGTPVHEANRELKDAVLCVCDLFQPVHKSCFAKDSL